LFRDRNICECAGEQAPAVSGEIQLTTYVRNPGCASKIGKQQLAEVLRDLPDITDSRVVVGRSAGDDAGVILLNDDTATVLTVDVFSPSVDDPYTFGQIAAANSLSDVYAMGATPEAALSIIGFPVHTLPADTMHEILRGGVEKMAEAGISVVGGHSINDEEVKCGFAVIGTASPDKILTNAAAEPGDSVVLTKPLGVGIIAFARQIGRADSAAVRAATESMVSLNRDASVLMHKHQAHAATDVTGFSLLGHLAEAALQSGVNVEIDFDAIPFFPTVRELACQDVLPGAVERNRESVAPDRIDFTNLTVAQQSTLFCPETSGGLLVFLPAANADEFVRDLNSTGMLAAAVIGRVTESSAAGRVCVRTESASDWEPIALVPGAVDADADAVPASECCANAAADAEDKPVAGTCCASAAADPTEPVPPPVARSPEDVDVRVPRPSATEEFAQYMSAVNSPGALDAKLKTLIALSLSVLSKCEPCVKINTRAAREAGATENELSEAVALGIAFGGAPAAMFYSKINW